VINQYHSRTFNGRCDASDSAQHDIRKNTGAELVRQYSLLNWVSWVLESHSLMYCAVPKVATKSVLAAIVYTHFRDINDHIHNNWTNIDAARARTEQFINVRVLIEQLRKV
jgi:hypothetical protein